MSVKKRIICQKCIYYYVTWEASKPHGCRAYGFKSKLLPSMVVEKTSSMPCQYYKTKSIAKN